MPGRSASRKPESRRVLKARYPDEPWRWRAEWEEGVIPASREGGPLVAWLGAVVFLAIGGTATVLAWDKLMGGGPSLLWFVFLFPLIGVLLLLGAVVATVRVLKYGRPVLRLGDCRCELGGVLQGTIEFRGRRLPAVESAELELQERLTTRHKTSDGSETRTRVVWSLRTPVDTVAGENKVSVSLPVPSDGNPLSGEGMPSTDWRLSLRAATPGADLVVAFDLPVRPGDGGNPAQTKDALDEAQAEIMVQAGEEALVEKLRQERIRLTRHPAGLELRVRPLGLRRWGFGITALVFAAIPALYWFLVLSRHPSVWRWLGFVPLAGLGLLVFGLLMTKSFRVRSGKQGLRIVRHILGIPSVYQVRHEEITSLSANSSMSSSGANGTVRYHDLALKWQRGGRSATVTVTLGITDKALAGALALALRSVDRPSQ